MSFVGAPAAEATRTRTKQSNEQRIATVVATDSCSVYMSAIVAVLW